ncbi:Nca2 protein [Martiniozyma asiatica (nom. inval.)]|nr:Nca2 protein [Martiniozyma asiatica]
MYMQHNVSLLADYNSILAQNSLLEYSGNATTRSQLYAFIGQCLEALSESKNGLGRFYSGQNENSLMGLPDKEGANDKTQLISHEKSWDSLQKMLATHEVAMVGHDENVNNLVISTSTLMIIDRLIEHLLSTLLKTMDELNYFDLTLLRSRTIAIYTIQSMPRHIWELCTDITKNINSNKKEEINNSYKNFSINGSDSFKLLALKLKDQIDHLFASVLKLVKSATYKTLEMPIKQLGKANNYSEWFHIAAGLPLVHSHKELESKRKTLRKLKKNNIELLGWLLNNLPELKIYKKDSKDSSLVDLSIDTMNQYSIDFDYSIISKLELLISTRNVNSTDFSSFSTLKSTAKSTTPSQVKNLEILNTLAGEIPTFEQNTMRIIANASKPGYISRHWPIILPAIILAPKCLTYAYNNWNEFYDWIQITSNSIKETLLAFWKNWVLQPVENVIKTIRHDPNSKLSVMSEQSLESDLKSLERMVISYVEDNNIPISTNFNNGQLSTASSSSSSSSSLVTLSSLTSDQKDQVIIQLSNSIQNGNLTPLLQDYELSLPHPIKSLILGQMLRNVLIQIQKTKVDGAVALSGIDKVLKSQELVFGCIAASPALVGVGLVLNHFWKTLSSCIWGEPIGKSSSILVKSRVRVTLGMVDRLVGKLNSANNSNSNSNSNGDNYQTGLLYIEVLHLEKLGIQVLPKFLHNEWRRDLEEIVINKESNTLRRMWNVWGCYF